ncbi:COG4-domain-containing protein [Fomitiporia mediterranea MF3/22]|uniref:COG4-domain-containing protein n=1 Tax=Fomitiporia mediterranea (strain MF3/22) TaxID=694068 RepID=UPI000440858D|nr:COG4-domain-containing protein [Fomitiporia mediterranea MF3/22]EJD05663.1 COG4-domain-containing protein [Fomitiporia mediterranea MF3/22]
MNGVLQSRPEPSKLTTLPDILASLASLEEEENQLSESLTAILSDDEPVRTSLDNLQSLAPRLDEITVDARLLVNNVTATSRTAERVGGRVRLLDEEMKRVKEAGERVAQVMELKNSLADLQFAIDSQDWEAATRHCARAMALPLEVIAGPFAESAVPTADLPLPPAQTLQAFREQLRDIFLHQFVQASNARDSATTTRFFKLLPPIGWEKEGLEAYAAFVLTLVQSKSPASAKSSSPLYYVTALTALFESVCSILDQHQPVVEKYYGKGKMQTVVKHLIKECDSVVKRLLDSWEEERSLGRLVTVTSFSSVMSTTGRKQAPNVSAIEEQSVDPRDVDKVLNEITAMVMRYTAFRRFLYTYLTVEDAEPSNTTNDESPEGMDSFEVIETSGCKAMFDNVISNYYVPLEVWYLRSTIHQAHKTSIVDSSQVPPVTTVPDLVFYILKSILIRLLSTGSIGAVKGTTGRIREAMENDYAGIIKRKLDDVYKNPAMSSAASRAERLEKDNRQGFIVLLNDLDVSSTHIDRLVRELLSSQALSQNFLQSERDLVDADLNSLLNLITRFRSTMKSGIDQLFNQLIRPRLRTFITDLYRDVSYVLDEDGFSASEYADTVRKRFIKAWEGIMDGFKESFTESNYRIFIGQVIDVLIRPWEKYVMTLKYTELGAIRFDQDIRAISTYLSSQVALGDVREKLQRLQQISTLLNIDKDEDVDDFFSSSGIAWKLSMAEARAIAALKV